MSRFGDRLARAFHPRVVAVVGDKKGNDFLWLRALRQFDGTLYSVQIDAAEIPAIEALGVVNVPSLLAIPEEVDYVVVAVPRSVVPRVLADCARKAVGAVTLFTAGFSEIGDAEGRRLEADVAAIAEQAGLLVIGPNCMGITNPSLGLCNFPGQPAGSAAAGHVAFLGQSGTHTISLCVRGPAEGVGIGKAVSFGNGIVADAADFLDYFRTDPDTRVIAAYIEGVRNGRRFYDVLRQTTPAKPVLLWKGGLTAAGERAIFSHTAALATPAAVWRGMVRQAGALPVDSQDDLLDAARALLAAPPVAGRRAGLIAMTGGPSVAITDAFMEAGLEVPLLSDASYERLAAFFQVVGGSFRNPLDAGSTIAMGFRADNLARLLDVLEGDPSIDLLAIDLGATLSIERWLDHPQLFDALATGLAVFADRSAKPLAVILDAPHRPAESAHFRQTLARRGLLTFHSAVRAARALLAVSTYHRWRAGLD